MSEIEEKNLEEVLALTEKLEEMVKSGHEFTEQEIKEYSKKLSVTEEEFIEGMKESAMEEDEEEDEISDEEMEKQQIEEMARVQALIKEGHIFTDEEITEISEKIGLDEEYVLESILDSEVNNNVASKRKATNVVHNASLIGSIVRFFKNLFK